MRRKKEYMGLLDLLFPRRCPVCDRVQPLGELICPSCDEKLKRIESPYCRKCGKALADERQEYCSDCAEAEHLYKEGRALYEYPFIRQSIARFKYRGRQEYAEFYARQIERYLGDVIRSWRPDALVPVPLHPSRMRKRGYNQAALLACRLGKRMGIPVEMHLVKRIKKTVPQKQLNRALRQNNLKKAFKICRNDVKLSTIIIIDDIYTTGSTVDAMTAALQDAGIRTVCFVALAAGRE